MSFYKQCHCQQLLLRLFLWQKVFLVKTVNCKVYGLSRVTETLSLERHIELF